MISEKSGHLNMVVRKAVVGKRVVGKGVVGKTVIRRTSGGKIFCKKKLCRTTVFKIWKKKCTKNAAKHAT